MGRLATTLIKDAKAQADVDGVTVPTRLIGALEVLLEAFTYAEQSPLTEWDFAVDASELQELGLNCRDVNWLLSRGFVQLREQDVIREASPVESLPRSNWPESATVVLTTEGARLAMTTIEQVRGPKPVAVPHWDASRRELKVGGELVKRFRIPAQNQETILTAFHEDGWPARIDDPLPPKAEQNPKRRLYETIKSLNRNQQLKLIRFCGDGTGQGVCWQLCD